jgi:alkaline phosphatase D
MKNIFSLIFFIVSFNSFSQVIDDQKLVSGPMQGHTTATGTSIWLMVKNADSVAVRLTEISSGTDFIQQQSTTGINKFEKFSPLTFQFSDLKPSSVFEVEVIIDGKPVRKKFFANTFSNDSISNFSFMLGSCALWVPKALRWMHPGIEESIYRDMKKEKGDFMLWLGDYLYYLPKNYKSPVGMYKRQVLTRQHNLHMDFMRSRPQYSIWDDHEYGWNNSDKDFKFKKESLELHKLFWPNPAFGTESNPGVYYSFSYNDADFFMTDGRYYRTIELIPNAEMLGSEQLQWLMNELKKSKATFKFVAFGSQVLNPVSTNESFYKYPEEYKKLMDFILKEKITGVIFLSGDRHHTELIKINREEAYPMYDFTCSAITSFRRNTSRSGEKNNPHRVKGTLFDRQNYGRIEITGAKGSRVCKLLTYNNRGKLAWEVSISENDLKYFRQQ